MSILSSTKIGAVNIPLTRKILLEKGYVKVVPENRRVFSRGFQSNRYKYDKKHYLTVKERNIDTDEEEVHVFIDILYNLENRTGRIFSNYIIRCFFFTLSWLSVFCILTVCLSGMKLPW